MWGYHIKYGRLSADVMLSQRMRRSVSSLDTQCFKPMIHSVSIHGTQGFSIWNAGFQCMERTVSSHENAVIGSLFKAFVRFFKEKADVFLGIRNRLGIK